MTPYITTQRGRFELFAPEKYEYDLEEIAKVLNRIFRFGGHTHWSVLSHSFMVALRTQKMLGQDTSDASIFIRQALLHDAAEAFWGDTPTPIKFLDTAERTYLEDRTLRAILKQFNLPLQLDPIVHEADQQQFADESHRFFPHVDWVEPPKEKLPMLFVRPSQFVKFFSEH